MTDIFAIQDEITHAIAAALRIRLSRDTARVRRHVPHLRAYEPYLKAREHWYLGVIFPADEIARCPPGSPPFEVLIRPLPH